MDTIKNYCEQNNKQLSITITYTPSRTVSVVSRHGKYYLITRGELQDSDFTNVEGYFKTEKTAELQRAYKYYTTNKNAGKWIAKTAPFANHLAVGDTLDEALKALLKLIEK